MTPHEKLIKLVVDNKRMENFIGNLLNEKYRLNEELDKSENHLMIASLFLFILGTVFGIHFKDIIAVF